MSAQPPPRDLPIRLMISVAALAVLTLKLLAPDRVDITAAALLLLALIPWMSTVLASVDTAAGGFVLREIKRTQDTQQDELDRMKFLFEHLIPAEELRHLQNLADDTPLPYDRSYTRPYLDTELRRLAGVGLIARKPGRSFSGMGDSGDVRDHFTITDTGRTYLHILRTFRS
ncbi:hypothetical protein M2164_000736 [Streptomyces sp. SAI-208]|uniref:hypothetical protein n=1 Tax=unclassified Streptomyces TaxID=2593676 RepID=UPI002472F932|nr:MULTISPECIES: hypothetical protein [unclassified Streptomyces]MDH6514260.1 hypothetical protein [Streptomyces sp. SAI-090]MDH6546442.1 hypothetical protein [Streptomyces sp. SAI-041]MDH6565539.1 hypothetical protein [Streptomyces sp. SAI-117]MDH6589542.1 hypothetical protein [Streptomyces sp. SAI-133]MDH6605101.1 hypothetical protein [Streptomyces sp. SAI-208]